LSVSPKLEPARAYAKKLRDSKDAGAFDYLLHLLYAYNKRELRCRRTKPTVVALKWM
jgi:hypothetical protein